VVAVWAFSRPAKPPQPSPEQVAAAVERLTQEPPYKAPDRARRSSARRAQQLGRPGSATAPGVLPSGSNFVPSPPAPSQPVSPALRAEEIAVRRILEPLVARRPNASLRNVRCLEPGGWKKRHEAEQVEIEDPLDVPARDPEQAVCRVQLRAQQREHLMGLLKDASGAYGGHLVGTDPREKLDAYLGHWWESDVQVDTQDPHPPPPP
jgi:hypothetical protein